MNNIILALSLSLLAGLCTAIGGIIAVTAVKSDRLLAVSISFAVGVMLYVALADILPQAGQLCNSSYSIVLFYCIGIALIAIIERCVPQPQSTITSNSNNGMRAGALTAIAIALHNIPEGMATYISAVEGIGVALPLVVAIALHNIPEGIAVSAPIYYYTGNKSTALLYSLWCGLAEPLGALLACWILSPYLSSSLLGLCYATVAGVMTYISIDMLPSAYRHNDRLATIGVLAGMVVMALSIAVLG